MLIWINFVSVLTSLHLVKLDISVNKISRIPFDLYLMATLDDLNICNNPLVMPPQHVRWLRLLDIVRRSRHDSFFAIRLL